MLRSIFLCLMVLLNIKSFGQNDSLQFKKLFDSNSKSEIISIGRKLIKDNFLAGDLDKVQELNDYLLNEVENKEYAVFYPVEYWFILYWTQDYQKLISSIIDVDSSEVEQFQKKIKPQYDLLFENLKNKSKDSKLFLELNIKNSDLSNVEKDFLSLHLKYILTDEDYAAITQDSLNASSDNFLSKYPNSKFETFIRTYVRYKYAPAKWSFAIELFSGFGLFTNSLEQNFGNNNPIGAAFDVSYKKFTLYFRDYIGRGKSIKDMSYDNGVWAKGSEYALLMAEASLGYIILENRHLKIAPFTGIATSNLGPVQYDLDDNPELEKVVLNFTSTYNLGLNADIKFSNSINPMFTQKPRQRYWFVRLRYAYNMFQFEQKYSGYDGNMHYLTIGIGWFSRKMKREY